MFRSFFPSFKRCVKYLCLFNLCVLALHIFIYQESLMEYPQGAKHHSYRCKIPKLDVNAKEIIQFIKPSRPIVCEGNDNVEVNKSFAFVRKDAGKDVYCIFSDVIRENDDENMLPGNFKLRRRYMLRASDFVRTRCFKNTTVVENLIAGIRIDDSVFKRTSWDKVPKDGLRLNVLMFGFDSMSRLMFERKLPKSLEYLRETLGSIEMKGYNIVGDGTGHALIPILTGQTERELSERRKRFRKTKFVDVYPFIWKDFERNGYVTGYGEDMHDVEAFHYRSKGFNKAPTTHYLRPWFVEASAMGLNTSSHCMGGTPTHTVMMKYVLDFYRVYRDKPKFFFLFYSETCHGSINGVGAVDEDFLNWIKTLYHENHLEETLLIVMSDHGARFNELRNTLQGKWEERLPMFSFAFPKWFPSLHPQIIKNLRHNAKVLTTPFDIHATLMDVIHFGGAHDGDLDQRSISLFKKIPSVRSCSEARIAPHWCTCLTWKYISVTEKVVQQAAMYVVKKINSMSDDFRSKCEELHLDEVLESFVLIPEPDLLRFVESKDIDGSVPHFKGLMSVNEAVLQIKLLIQPGDALYEVSVEYYPSDKTYFLDDSNISRISKYAPYIRCLSDTELHLRKFCFCRDSGSTFISK